MATERRTTHSVFASRRHPGSFAALVLMLVLTLGLVSGGTASSATTTTVYSNNFSTALGGEWSGAGILETPNSENVLASGDQGCWLVYHLGSRICGYKPFGSSAVTLTLSGLPVHSTVELSVELYTLRSWDGNNPHGYGPDKWDLDATGASSDVQPVTTFSNYEGFRQDYPDPYRCAYYEAGCVVPNPGATGSAATGDLLGLGTSGNSEIPAVRYDLFYSFDHTASDITFTFSGSVTEGWADEGWVLDDVVVNVIGAAPPSAPLSLQAVPGPVGTIGQVDLSWQPPANDGGAAITAYTLCRGTTGGGPYPTCVGLDGGTLSYSDTTGSPLTTYYYVVSATNVAGRGPDSGEACAKPSPWLTALGC